MWIECSDCRLETKCTTMETPQGDKDLCRNCIDNRRARGEKVLAMNRDRSKDKVN